VTFLIGDHHRFVVSAVTLVMALLVAQTRVESGIHSLLEVIYGGALGALTTLVIFQLVG
jgi:diacylglycerol kinase (ATP)